MHRSTVTTLMIDVLDNGCYPAARMTTQAQARAKRTAELQTIADAVKSRREFTLAPELDADARALYWIEPWDQRRYVKDEKGKWKKDADGNAVVEVIRDPRLAIHIHLGSFRLSPRGLELRWWGFHVTGPHRCIGFLESGTLSTYREYVRNWHKTLQGWTVNLHILENSERFGFTEVEINGKVYPVERLLKCPLVSRKDSGGYEVNVLLRDPQNVYDPLKARVTIPAEELS
jgi:hypothetical protein